MPEILSTYNIVDVLTAIDVEKILSDLPASQLSKNPQYPTTLKSNGHDEIYMITTDKNVISGQAGDALNVSVDVNDIIRWRTTSLTVVADYRCIIYQVKLKKNIEGAHPDYPLLSDPHFAHTYPSEPDPKPGWPNNGVEKRTSSDYFWHSTAQSEGTAIYTFVVAIYKHNSVEPLGYFSWDPKITIRN
ncbi:MULTISPECIES: AidA/PixA family protein [Burkholderia cepacia complex]|uniref:Inclusion body protein n=1 Tax=Burkholderia cepacia TaxID=292 RepID=A0A1B4Q3H0_BURCE|nr:MULTISPECIES: AidA/PixA family protein [Burkholderia cepacia complex]AOK20717.1 hypothetical protein WT26_33925 [Burkholderia cepacia]